jgi:hypothetical protein
VVDGWEIVLGVDKVYLRKDWKWFVRFSLGTLSSFVRKTNSRTLRLIAKKPTANYAVK